MLKEDILNKFAQGKIYGIEVLHEKEVTRFFVVLCEIKKGKLELLESYKFQDFDTLNNNLDKSIPITISVTGNGVINKRVNKEPNYRTKVLFNSNPEEFYWVEYTQESEIFLSVARKQLIDDVLKKFTEEKLKIVSLFIGSFILSIFKNIIVGNVLTNTLNLHFSESKVNDFQSKEWEDEHFITIGEQEISSNLLVGYATVANYFFSNNDIQSLSVNKDLREEFLYAKMTRKIGIPFVITLFVTMLLSYLGQSIINDSIASYGAKRTEQEQLSGLLNKSKIDKEQKEQILQRSGIANSNFLSFYVWKIIDVMPQNIELETLDIFPLERKIEKSKQVNFKNQLIVTSGLVKSNTFLNTWVKEIRENDWVKSVEVKDYIKEKSINHFELNIILSND